MHLTLDIALERTQEIVVRSLHELHLHGLEKSLSRTLSGTRRLRRNFTASFSVVRSRAEGYFSSNSTMRFMSATEYT